MKIKTLQTSALFDDNFPTVQCGQLTSNHNQTVVHKKSVSFKDGQIFENRYCEIKGDPSLCPAVSTLSEDLYNVVPVLSFLILKNNQYFPFSPICSDFNFSILDIAS